MAKKTVTQVYTKKGLTGLPKKRKWVPRRKYLGTDNWGIDRVEYMRPRQGKVKKHYGK